MPPKPTSKILLALDNPYGKGAEGKGSHGAETGKAPRVCVPHYLFLLGWLTRFGLFTGCSDRERNLPYQGTKKLNVPKLPKPSRRLQAMRVLRDPQGSYPCIRIWTTNIRRL